MCEFITKPDNNPHTPTEPDATIEPIRARVGNRQEPTIEGTKGFQIIALRPTGELIGYGGFNSFDLNEELAENAPPPLVT